MSPTGISSSPWSRPMRKVARQPTTTFSASITARSSNIGMFFRQSPRRNNGRIRTAHTDVKQSEKYPRFDAERLWEEGMKLVVPTVALFMLLGATIADAQTARERTIEEIKVEAQARAERGAYPLIGLDP